MIIRYFILIHHYLIQSLFLNDIKQCFLNYLFQIILSQIIFSVSRNVSFSDNGKYKCNVSNPFGWVSEEGMLKIKLPTKIELGMKDITVQAGKTGLLVCNVTHDKDVNLNIKWLKNKEHILSLSKKILSSITTHRTSRNKYQTDASLTIHNATKRHSGEYTCLVETEVDFDQTSSKVKVKQTENFLVVYISVSICLVIATVTYLTYPYCIQTKK